MSANKRKRVRLTLEDKRVIIQEIEQGSGTTAILGKRYKVHETTVRHIVNGKEKIFSAFANATEGISIEERKSLRGSQRPQLEQTLFAWILQERQRNHIITQDLIKEKANIFHARMIELCGDVFGEFKASSGWLQKFRQRFGLKTLALTGEKVSADEISFEEFKVRN